MSRTYKATGVNLKGMPLGESDRLVTILTAEVGLIRVIAPGARKTNSKLAGRSGLFVVNELLIAKGRSLDKISQAETLESYPGLSRDLTKLTASQYLAEVVLCQALSEQPQVELFWLLCEHLTRLEQAPASDVLACLAQAMFHLLTWAGIAPQVQACCLTQVPVIPDFTHPEWRVEFCAAAGGVVSLGAPTAPPHFIQYSSSPRVAEAQPSYLTPSGLAAKIQLNASALSLLQQLAQPDRSCLIVPDIPRDQQDSKSSESTWLSVERALRQYAQYHFNRPIRSAALIDACLFPSAS